MVEGYLEWWYVGGSVVVNGGSVVGARSSLSRSCYFVKYLFLHFSSP